MRSAANSGTGLKPSDIYAVPLCTLHHKEFHDIGAGRFQELHHANLWEYAAQLAAKSPDKRMQEYLNARS